MKLKVSENIYGQYVYIFSVITRTVDVRGKTSSSSSRGSSHGGGGSYNENHIQLNDGAYLKKALGEFHCTLEMILD
jgi:hypothetical protein